MPRDNTTGAVGGRTQNLALIFQDVLTATVRLRANRQSVSDAESFRHHMLEALRIATQEARNSGGYAVEDIRLGAFAVVGFLDESILNAKNPLFANWPRKPLQEELFGTHMAGEQFFQNVQALLARNDSVDLADLLEVHYLCLLLGYRGRYSAGGDLRGVMNEIAEKIRRIRGPAQGLSPAWALPEEFAPPPRDPWTRRFTIGALACLALALILFIAFKISLNSGASEIQSIAGGRI